MEEVYRIHLRTFHGDEFSTGKLPFELKSYVINTIQPDDEQVIDELVSELSKNPIVDLQKFIISFSVKIIVLKNN